MKYSKRHIAIQIVMVLLLSFSGFIFAQNDPLEKPITLQLQDESFENLLALITEQTGVKFSYSSQLINPKEEVTIDIQNKTVKEVLFTVLPVDISYKKIGEHIVFYAEKGEKQGIAGQARNDNGVSQKNTPANNGSTTDSCLNTVSLTQEEEMKTHIAGLMLAAATAIMPVAAQDTQENKSVQNIENQQQIACKPIQVAFIYPLGTGFVKTAENCYHVSINVLGGVTGQTKGFELGSLFNINKYGATGVQFAGLFNATGEGKSGMSSHNLQFAGLFNHTKKGKSAQFAGLFNIGDTAYFQAGGLFNVAKEAGFQAGGLFNIANKTVFQAAGVFNNGGTAHFQAAGVWNTAKETKCQIAGIANVAQESACQIASIVNVTKKGRFQMGLINVRDTADGVSLGLINIVKKGGVLEAGIEAGEFIHTALTFRSGVQYLYSILFVGYNYTEHYWSWGAGLGTSIKLVGNLSLNLELTERTIFRNVSRFPINSLIQFNPVLNYRFAKHFKIYAGPSINFLFQQHNQYLGDFDPTKICQIKTPYSLYHRSSYSPIMTYERTFDIWIGIVGGIKF